MSRPKLPEDELRKRRNAYARRYYAEHHQEMREKYHRRVAADPQRYRNYHLKWLENNREKWNAYMREYNKKRKEAKHEPDCSP